jgi:hypothetical protein
MLNSFRILSSFALLLLSSCSNKNIDDLQQLGSSIQLYPTKDGTLEAVNTDGEGTRRLKLLSKNGHVVEEITMHNEPFRISDWKGYVVRITYYTSDLSLFKPWYDTNKFKPLSIGQYSIVYDYKVVSESSSATSEIADSVRVDKTNNSISLFSNQKLLNQYPIPSVTFQDDRVSVSDFETHTVIDYHISEKSIIRSLDSLTGKYH